jgi:hypothetical protein
VSRDVAGNNRRVIAAWDKGWTCHSAAHAGSGSFSTCKAVGEESGSPPTADVSSQSYPRR